MANATGLQVGNGQRNGRRRGKAHLSNLDSLIARLRKKHGLTIVEKSCRDIAKCGFRDGNLELAIVATDILIDEEPVTLRGLMYRVVSAGWLPSTDHEHYTRLGRIMTRLREAGVVPFSWIVDGVRSTDKPSSWSGLADYARAVRRCYRLDFWGRLPHYIHFIVEKDAVAGTLSPVTREYDVALSPIRGYSSLSFAHEIATTWNAIDKPVFCYFLGDFDPSGFDLQRDIQEKLARYCPDRTLYDDRSDFLSDADGDLSSIFRYCTKRDIIFHRVGVIASDFEEFNLIPLKVKKDDTRANKFRSEHGNRCAELDALPSTELRRRVRSIIESHIEPHRDEWERLQRVEAEERNTLDQFIAGMDGNTKSPDK
jgi:hypothetical protein